MSAARFACLPSEGAIRRFHARFRCALPAVQLTLRRREYNRGSRKRISRDVRLVADARHRPVERPPRDRVNEGV